MRLLLGFGAGQILLVLVGLAIRIPGAPNVGSIARTNWFVAVMAVAAVLYFFAIRHVLRGKLPRGALWVVLGVALLMRLPVLAPPPFLSSDLFRYIWDGRVQLAGINPYRYIPADPALESLRDPVIYPNVNRRDYAPTIYPPAAQLLFRAIASVSQTALAVKLAMIGFEALAIGSLIALLRLAGLPAARVLIYAWNPLAVWTFAGNGHVDAAGAGLLALALLLRGMRRQGWAGAALAAAALTKFLPIVAAPALWRRPDWRMPLVCAAVMLGLYAWYADAGWHVFGFLSGYGAEEGIESGGGIWLLAGLAAFFRLPAGAGPIFLGFAGLGLAGLGAWIAFRAPTLGIVEMCRYVGVLTCLLLIVVSPHYPWYFPWLAVPACVAPARSSIWLASSALLLHLDPWHERFFWPALVFFPALALLLIETVMRRAANRLSPAQTDKSFLVLFFKKEHPSRSLP